VTPVAAPARRATKTTVARAPRTNVQHPEIAAVAPAAEPAPAAVAPTESGDTSSAVAARYVAVGKALRGSSDELWARYRLIRINDALRSEASRREVLATLTDIERARSSAR
jgi:hypothetical protein